MSEKKSAITRETFDAMNQKGRDGVLFDLSNSIYERVTILEDKDKSDTKAATKAGAIAGFIGGAGTVASLLGAKFLGIFSW